MISDSKNLQTQRVVLALDAMSEPAFTLELAIELAASLQSQLQGLLIEDADLFSIAGLPFSREICLTTGQQRALNTQQLQRRLDSIGHRFQRLLAQKAEQSVVQWSYAAVRARKQDLPLGEYADAAYLILEQSTQRAHRIPHESTTKRILMVRDHAAHLYRALELISQKITASNIELYVAQTIDGDHSVQQENAWSRGASTSQHRQVKWIDAQQVEQLMTQKLDYFDYVLIARSAEPVLLQNIVKWSSCPVIVVS